MNVTHYKLSRQTIPLLVPCPPKEPHDGIANFYIEKTPHGHRSGPRIRLVTQKDLRDAELRKTLDQRELDLLIGAVMLRHGLEKRDEHERRHGFEKLMPWLDPGLNSAGLLDHFAGVPGHAVIKLSRAATQLVEDARLVLWFWPKQQRFTPAVYCPSLKTALFINSLLGRIRVCPYCATVFTTEKKNVDYCCTAHRDAHRMARWRAKGKAAKRRDR